MTVVAITGAAGFLGKRIVAAAVSRGYDVRAIVRNDTHSLSGAKIISADIRDSQALSGIFDDVDIVVHAAAAKGGTFHEQYASTVNGTRTLLNALSGSPVKTLVLVSSFAVYDYSALRSNSVLDEHSPIISAGPGRDAYAQTKVIQEKLCVDWARELGVSLVVARPGVIFGPESVWTYRVGERFGRMWIGLGNSARLPLSYVENCADAIMHLAATRVEGVEIANVFDTDRVRQGEYRRLLARAEDRRPLIIDIPYLLMRGVVRALARFNKRRANPYRFPGFLIPESLDVRSKPLTYSNVRLRALGWVPPVPLATALQTSLSRSPRVKKEATA